MQQLIQTTHRLWIACTCKENKNNFLHIFIIEYL